MSSTESVLGRHRDALARILPFAAYIAFLAAGPFVAELFPGFDSRWLYALQIGVVILALSLFARHYTELRYTPSITMPQWLTALAMGVAVFVVWINLDQPWATLGGPATGFDPRDAAGAIDWPLVVVRVFGAAAVVPVMEELFWRSFIMRWIERADFLHVVPAAVGLKALLISSLVFGIEHHLWLAGVIAGLAYGWLYMRSGNLWVPIFAHAVTNLLLGIWVLTTGNWQFW